MRKIAMLLILGLWSVLASAQGKEGGGANREPAAGRDPAGARSGKEGGGGADRGGSGGEVKTKDKPGKSSVSPDAIKTAETIKATNSTNATGSKMNDTQRAEAERQLNDQKIQAAADNRPADVKFFEKEKEKLKKN